jgi:hypothetical protein
MDFGAFKLVLGSFFFGAAFLFGFWQLAELRRLERTPKVLRNFQDGEAGQ